MLIPCLLFDYKAPIVLLQIPYKACFFPPFSFEILCFPHVYKAPCSSEEPRWNPPLNRTKLSLSQLVSISLPLFFECCRLQCRSKGSSIQVYPSLSLFKYFPRLRWSLGSLSVTPHHFWMSGAPLSLCCTNLQV